MLNTNLHNRNKVGLGNFFSIWRGLVVMLWHRDYTNRLDLFRYSLERSKKHTHTSQQAHVYICGAADYMNRRGKDGWMKEKGGGGGRKSLSRTPTPPTDYQLPSPSTPSCNLHSSTGSLKPCVRPPPTNYLATLPLSPAQAWCCCMMGFLYIEFHLLVR